ncbi:Mucin-associated surface protein (MASP), subgroup S072 [Trypanosoma cruzi]|nr:Mucin-associated surface protein (MASP), subgroup S072 [Trypanosoma cruzi]
MAMMMTGRVLLVCALCVLWCDVAAASAGGGDVATEVDEQKRTTEVLPSVGKSESQVTSVEESTGKAAGNVKTPQNSQAAILSTKNGPSDQKQEDEKKKKEKEGDTKDGEDEGKGEEEREKIEKRPTPPPPSGQKSTPTINGNSAGTPNETRAKEMHSSDKDSTQEQVLKSPAAPTAPEATPQVKNENPSSADAVSVQQVQKAQTGLESGNESRKEESVLTTNKQQDGTSDSHDESTPTSRSSAKSVAASNGPDKATEEEISNKNTAGVDAVPEATQHYGSKDANKKETPIKTKTIANSTASTGDSDSSTAVSHTTSPLLLLLAVACAAAAAAVVAA